MAYPVRACVQAGLALGSGGEFSLVLLNKSGASRKVAVDALVQPGRWRDAFDGRVVDEETMHRLRHEEDQRLMRPARERATS